MLFDVQTFGVDGVNVDDRCHQLHGSYQAIPPAVRRQAQRECEQFVKRHITGLQSFATETTLGGAPVAFRQARLAKEAGFFTSIVYLSTSDIELNIERIRRRGLAGGHSAPAAVIRQIYRESHQNLAEALLIFERAEVYDSSGPEPVLILLVEKGRVEYRSETLPDWAREACRKAGLEV